MGNITKEKAMLGLVIIVFGSGLGIYVWNLIQGRDLGKSPQFDLSAYDNVPELQAIGEYLDGNKGQNAIVPVVEEEKTVAPTLSAGYIYFRPSLQGGDYIETKKMVENFLKDFPLLQKMSANVEYLDYMKLLNVQLPDVGQEEIVQQLELDASVASVNNVDGLDYTVEFKKEKKLSEINTFLATYPAVKLKAPLVEESDYIARLNYGDKLPLSSELGKLKSDYSDIVTIQE